MDPAVPSSWAMISGKQCLRRYLGPSGLGLFLVNQEKRRRHSICGFARASFFAYPNTSNLHLSIHVFGAHVSNILNAYVYRMWQEKQKHPMIDELKWLKNVEGSKQRVIRYRPIQIRA
jgi:hypothetical protein